MRKQKARTILVTYNLVTLSGRDCLAGIIRAVGSRRPWRLRLLESPKAIPDALARVGSERIDGVISCRPLGTDVIDALRAANLPTVFTNYQDEREMAGGPFSSVRLDDEAIGRAAAERLLSLGAFAAFAFATNRPDARWSALRARGFVRRVPLPVTHLPLDEGEGAVLRRLAELPKPLAVLAAWDVAAVQVAELCHKARLEVPSQVAILGVDDDELLCNGATPRLSSVKPNHEELGFRACDELERLFKGRPPRTTFLSVSVKAFARRETTAFLKPSEHLVRRAREYIRDHADRAIPLAEIVRHLSCSRALACLRFRELTGQSLGAAIADARTAFVKSRLADSSGSLAALAPECGFADGAALARFFRRETGLSPGAWRKKAVGGQPPSAQKAQKDLWGPPPDGACPQT